MEQLREFEHLKTLRSWEQMRWPPNRAWTSAKKRQGYRHFQVNQYGGKGLERWVELYPVLAKELRIRVPIAEMTDQNKWESGWQQIPEAEASESKTDEMKNF